MHLPRECSAFHVKWYKNSPQRPFNWLWWSPLLVLLMKCTQEKNKYNHTVVERKAIKRLYRLNEAYNVIKQVITYLIPSVSMGGVSRGNWFDVIHMENVIYDTCVTFISAQYLSLSIVTSNDWRWRSRSSTHQLFEWLDRHIITDSKSKAIMSFWHQWINVIKLCLHWLTCWTQW